MFSTSSSEWLKAASRIMQVSTRQRYLLLQQFISVNQRKEDTHVTIYERAVATPSPLVASDYYFLKRPILHVLRWGVKWINFVSGSLGLWNLSIAELQITWKFSVEVSSKGPNRVAISLQSTEDENRSNIRNVVFCRYCDRKAECRNKILTTRSGRCWAIKFPTSQQYRPSVT